MSIEQSSNTCQLNFTPDMEMKSSAKQEEYSNINTPIRRLFEQWIKQRAPIAEFTKNKQGEYIVIGMQAQFDAFLAGYSACIRWQK